MSGRALVITELTADDYIQDGLTFQLDGIDKGSDNTVWTDLKGGIKFAYNSHSDVQRDGIKFDGAGYIQSDKSFGQSYSTGTIEVVFSDVAFRGVIMMSHNARDLCLAFGGGGYCYYPRNGNNQILCTIPAKATVSINAATAVQNGTALTEGRNNNNWNANSNSKLSVGAKNTSNYYYVKVKVHAIRIYNRQLTVNEMLFNQHIDNVRFGLGLTI